MDSRLIEKLKPHEGKRYICMVRCSDEGQAETSNPTQLKDIHEAGACCGLVHAGGDVVLDGVSGSLPGKREDFDRLFARKKEKNDFELVISLLEDRFTRAGPGHGMWAEHEFLRHGIEVIHLRSDIPAGPYASLMKAMKYESARQQACNTSLRSCAGYFDALKSGHAVTCTHTPYGCFRLYLSREGAKLFILQDLRDGTQQMLDPETLAMKGALGSVGGGSKGHYRKQKWERVMLVPGLETEVGVVKLIFHRRWVDGWGGHRIADALNDMKIPAPWGGRWTQRQVDVVAENLLYTGTSMGNLRTAAIFHVRGEGGPQVVTVDPVILATKKNLPVKLRPPEEWFLQPHPYLRTLLPEAVRAVAETQIKALWERRARGEVAERTRNTHLDSLYLLTGLLRAKQDGRLLKGQNCGPQGRRVRYYAHPVAREDAVKAGFANTTFRSEVLERAVLGTLGETLRAMPQLREEVQLAVEAALNARKPAVPHVLADLERQLDGVRAQIKVTYDVLTPETKLEGQAKIAELSQKRQALEAQIRQAKTDQQAPVVDVEAAVEALVQRLGDLGHQIESLPVYQLRQVLSALTDSMVADMVTREVTMSLKVPPMALSDAKTALSELCLQHTSGSSTSLPAQPPWPVLAHIHCQHARVDQKPCYTCRRLRVSA